MAYLQARAPEWRPIAMYGLAGSALVAVALYSFTALVAIPGRSPEVTPKTIETRIREWTDTLGLGLRRDDPDASAHFVFVVTLRNGNHVLVIRPKERSGWLTLQMTLTLSREHAGVIDQLPKADADSVASHVAIEIARSDIGFALIGPPPLKDIRLSKGVAITNDLSEGAFANYLDRMDNALTLARETIVSDLARLAAGQKREPNAQ